MDLENWDQLLECDVNMPLPNYVERDIYDRAVDLVKALLVDTPISDLADIINLAKEYRTMASTCMALFSTNSSRALAADIS